MHSAEVKEATGANVLRERISRFLHNGSGWKSPLREVVSTIEERGWKAVLFGGVLRDLSRFGQTEKPRDVDIVVDGVSQTELERTFGTWIVRRNRFGGLHLLVGNWMFDVWDIRATWGIVEFGFGRPKVMVEANIHIPPDRFGMNDINELGPDRPGLLAGYARLLG